jgi:hypothetical protein
MIRQGEHVGSFLGVVRDVDVSEGNIAGSEGGFDLTAVFAAVDGENGDVSHGLEVFGLNVKLA